MILNIKLILSNNLFTMSYHRGMQKANLFPTHPNLSVFYFMVKRHLQKKRKDFFPLVVFPPNAFFPSAVPLFGALSIKTIYRRLIRICNLDDSEKIGFSYKNSRVFSQWMLWIRDNNKYVCILVVFCLDKCWMCV